MHYYWQCITYIQHYYSKHYCRAGKYKYSIASAAFEYGTLRLTLTVAATAPADFRLTDRQNCDIWYVSANDGQFSAKCRATFIMRHLAHERMRVSAFGSAGLFFNGGQLRFVHIPIKDHGGRGPISPGAGRLGAFP
jgi:hypothetical protein